MEVDEVGIMLAFCCEELISVSLGSSVSTKEQLYIALIEGRHRPHEGLTLF